MSSRVRSLLPESSGMPTKTARGMPTKPSRCRRRAARVPRSLAALEEALYTADLRRRDHHEILEEIKRATAGTGLAGRRPPPSVPPLRRGAGRQRRPVGRRTRRPGGHPIPRSSASSAVNGSGKTTPRAKLAWMLKQDGRSVTVAGGDTFRAAAIEQLRTWTAAARPLSWSQPHGADAAAVAFDACRPRRRAAVTVSSSTPPDAAHQEQPHGGAGEDPPRAAKARPGGAATRLAGDRRLAWLQLHRGRPKVSTRASALTGLVVTKLDGTSRGGALVGIWRELKLPVYFVGLWRAGRGPAAFSVDNYVKAVFGPGGVRLES